MRWWAWAIIAASLVVIFAAYIAPIAVYYWGMWRDNG